MGTLFLLYLGILLFFYLFQERLIFYPAKIAPDLVFPYTTEFKEYFIELEEGVQLHGLLFKAPSTYEHSSEAQPSAAQSSGALIFYLHGNAGALDTWGYAADVFLERGYDVFIPDYRGYGKSEGEISSKKQFLKDVERAYQEMQKEYRQENIIIVGFSIGSGPAAWLAGRYQPAMLMLKAPYYSLKDLARNYFPFLPSGLLKYNFTTYSYLQEVSAPVVLIHGTTDEVIPFQSSVRLKDQLKPSDTLISLEGAGHNGIELHPGYRKALDRLLPKQ